MCLSVLGVACCRDVRVRTNSTCFRLHIPSTFPFLRDFLFACHQVLFLRRLWVVHFLLGNVTRVHLHFKCPPGYLQAIGITMYVIASHLEFNYTALVVRCGLLVCVSQGSLNVWGLSFAQLHFTIYVITSCLSFSCWVTFMLAAPTSISVSG